MALPGWLSTALEAAKLASEGFKKVSEGSSYFGDEAAPDVREQLENMKNNFSSNDLIPVQSISRPTDQEIETVAINYRITGIQNFTQPFRVPFDQTITVRYKGVAKERSGGAVAVADGVGASIIANIGGSIQELTNSRVIRTGVARYFGVGSHEDRFDVTRNFDVKAGQYVALNTIVGHELSRDISVLEVTITLDKPVTEEDEETAPDVGNGKKRIISPGLLIGGTLLIGSLIFLAR